MDYKSLIPAFFISVLMFATTIAIELNSTEIYRSDRFQHFAVSMLLFLFVYFIQTSTLEIRFLSALALSLSFGFFKEFTDPSFQIFDIVANIFGVSLGVVVVFFSNSIKVKPRIYVKRL